MDKTKMKDKTISEEQSHYFRNSVLNGEFNTPFKKHVREIWSKQWGKERVCAYCGASATSADHVIPVSWLSTSRKQGNAIYKEGGWKTIGCCADCNSLASGSLNASFAERKEMILERLIQKYKRYFMAKDWTEEDLEEMGQNLSDYIKQKMDFLQFLKLRIENLKNPLPIFAEYKPKSDD